MLPLLLYMMVDYAQCISFQGGDITATAFPCPRYTQYNQGVICFFKKTL